MESLQTDLGWEIRVRKMFEILCEKFRFRLYLSWGVLKSMWDRPSRPLSPAPSIVIWAARIENPLPPQSVSCLTKCDQCEIWVEYHRKKSARNCCSHFDSNRTFHQVNAAAVAPRIGASKSCCEHGHSNLYNVVFIVPRSVTLVSECEPCAHWSHSDTNATLRGTMEVRL